MNPRLPESVVIRVPSWVGDAVMAIPALRELRRIFSLSRVALLARPAVSGLFEGEDLADEIISLSETRGAVDRIKSFVRDAGMLRRWQFDMAVLLQNAFAAALLARVGGVGTIVGYATDRRRALLDVKVPFERDHSSLHQVRYYMNIASHVERLCAGNSGIDVEGQRPMLNVSDEQRAMARKLLEQFGVSPSRPVAAINPGATNSRAKRWPADRFAETAERFVRSEGCQIIIIGTAADQGVSNAVAARMKTPATVVAGKTDIAALKSILSLCSLVISNDTGAAHVSAALGVPTVIVFGPTQHYATRPLSDVAAVVRQEVECSPCMLRDCPIDHRCMTRVEVDAVCNAGRSLLAQAASR